MKKLFRGLLKKPDDDLFVTFVQVALEDQEIRGQLASILSQPHPVRLAKLSQWSRALNNEGAPAELIEILTYFEDEARANQTLLILQKIDLKSTN